MKHNDLDLTDWKDCGIETDSLWLIRQNLRQKRQTHKYLSRQFYSANSESINQTLHQKRQNHFKTFMGSGTTLFECENLGRKYIGFDINPKIVEFSFGKKFLPDKIFLSENVIR